MAYRDWKVFHKSSQTEEIVELSNVIDVNIQRVEDAESNSAEITLSNVNNQAFFSGQFVQAVDDIIKVYAAKGFVDTNNSEHLLGVYFIKTHEVSTLQRQVKLVCGDNTYKMLNKIYASDWENTTAKDIIFNIVQSTDQSGDTQNNVPTVMDSTKNDGTAFDTINYAVANKTAYEVVAELSQPQYTGDDKTYLFWFDEDEVFHWTYPDDTLNSYKIDFTDKDVIEAKPTKNEAETISSIIYDAGKDLDDITILDLYHDPRSTSTNIKYKTMLDINKYVRFSIASRFGLSDAENATLLTVVTNETFRKEVEKKARGRCAKYIAAYSRGLWEVKVKHKGRRFSMADLHTVKDSITNISLPNVRIKRIVHKLNKGGWDTNITLEEDEDEVLI